MTVKPKTGKIAFLIPSENKKTACTPLMRLNNNQLLFARSRRMIIQPAFSDGEKALK
jgi:hypothetical protein